MQHGAPIMIFPSGNQPHKWPLSFIIMGIQRVTPRPKVFSFFGGCTFLIETGYDPKENTYHSNYMNYLLHLHPPWVAPYTSKRTASQFCIGLINWYHITYMFGWQFLSTYLIMPQYMNTHHAPNINSRSCKEHNMCPCCFSCEFSKTCFLWIYNQGI